jgi:hypothetical protein
MLQALGTIWFKFLQKKSKKNFHACVPLREGGLRMKSFSCLPLEGIGHEMNILKI